MANLIYFLPETTTITPDQPKTSLLTDLPDGNFPPNLANWEGSCHQEGQSRGRFWVGRRALGMYYQQQQLNDNFRQWGPQGSSTHSYHGQWMGRDDDDGQSMSSSYSHHYSDPGVAVSTYMCTCTCIYVYLL